MQLLDRRPFGFKGKGIIYCQLCRGELVKVVHDGVLGGCIHGDLPEHTPFSDLLRLGQDHLMDFCNGNGCCQNATADKFVFKLQLAEPLTQRIAQLCNGDSCRQHAAATQHVKMLVYLSIYLSTYLPTYLSIYLSLSLSLPPSLSLSLYLPLEAWR